MTNYMNMETKREVPLTEREKEIKFQKNLAANLMKLMKKGKRKNNPDLFQNLKDQYDTAINEIAKLEEGSE